MKAKISVTFEFPTRAPETWTGTIEGKHPSTIVRRAVEEAQEKLFPRFWSSLVVVILERDDYNPQIEEATT